MTTIETKPGYKQTELGWIPEEWEIATIGESFVFQGGAQPDRSHFVFQERSGYIRLLQIRDYKSNKYESYIPENLVRRFCDVDDIMIGRYGPPIFQILRGYKGAYNVALIKAIPQGIINKTLGWYLLKQEPLFQFVEKLSQRSSGQTGVDLAQLKNYQIPLPPLPEQTAIATALSDMDSYIQSLEALIAKKRLIKQGAMQELLTPKEDWEVRKLGEVFNISGGYSASRDQLSNEGYCYLHYGDIHGSEKSYVNVDNEFGDIPKLEIALAKISSKSLLKNGDVVFVDASEDMDGVSKHIIIENPQGFPFISGLHTIVAKSKTDFLDLHYKKYCFQAKYIKEQFQYFAVGTKVSGISKSSIKQIDFHYPKMQDQKEIGSILTSMDNEIQSIDNELSKALQIKQGMMQELLTGRTRLV
jgi:type I restriction enzyme S subunit